MTNSNPEGEDTSYDYRPPHFPDNNSSNLEGIVTKEEDKETKPFNPSLSRIVYEMGKRTVKTAVKQLNPYCDTVAGALVAFAAVNLVPYAMPTAIRQISNCRSTLSELLDSKLSLSSIVGLCGQVTAYFLIIYGLDEKQGHPEVLLIPVATNTLSLLYEAGRGVYKKGLKIKNELIAEHKEKVQH